jgi:hypothetical protein
VLDSGIRQIVFVDKGQGYFEPREVKLGSKVDNYYLVLKGLKAGERVVTSGNFIIDSESRLRGAMAGMGSAAPPSTQAGKFEIKLTTQPDPPKVGENTFRIKVVDASGSPIADAEVEVSLFMPAMAGMPPMSSRAKLSSKGGGEYAGKVQVQTPGTWQVTVYVRRKGQLLGSTQLNINAR